MAAQARFTGLDQIENFDHNRENLWPATNVSLSFLADTWMKCCLTPARAPTERLSLVLVIELAYNER